MVGRYQAAENEVKVKSKVSSLDGVLDSSSIIYDAYVSSYHTGVSFYVFERLFI